MADAIAEPETKEPHIERETVQRNLFVPLTEIEQIEARKRVTDALDLIDRANADLANKKAEVKKTLTPLEGVLVGQRAALSRGVEQDVTCEVVRDFDKGKVTLMRLDTNEEVHSRDMGESERQENLELEEVEEETTSEEESDNTTEAAPADA